MTWRLTWISCGEVKVGEVDDVVVALLLLVEESELCWSPNNIVSDDALWRKEIKTISQRSVWRKSR